MSNDYTADILIVDDDPAHRLLTKRAIAELSNNSNIHEASCLLEARNLISKTNPEMIFLDLNLGGESGFELLQELRTNKKFDDLVIIVLSTSQLSQDIHKSYLLGANCFLSKEHDLKSNTHQIQSALRFFKVR